MFLTFNWLYSSQIHTHTHKQMVNEWKSWIKPPTYLPTYIWTSPTFIYHQFCFFRFVFIFKNKTKKNIQQLHTSLYTWLRQLVCVCVNLFLKKIKKKFPLGTTKQARNKWTWLPSPPKKKIRKPRIKKRNDAVLWNNVFIKMEEKKSKKYNEIKWNEKKSPPFNLTRFFIFLLEMNAWFVCMCVCVWNDVFSLIIEKYEYFC